MKISDLRARRISVPATSGGAVSAGQAQPKPGAASAASDHIQLSNLSAYLAAARSDSPAQVAKVFALQTAVAGGQYHVDAAVVSASIIQDSLHFSGANWL